MNAAAWIPWAWGAGAAVCFLLLCLLQPWRGQFRSAWALLRGERAVWMLPLASVILEWLWQWRLSVHADTSAQAAGWLAGDSLATALTWPVRGEIPAMLAAAAFFANSGGLRSGLLRGIDPVMGPVAARIFKILLLASATAALGIPAVRFGAGGEHGRTLILLMSSLWSSLAATLMVCWLLLRFETHRRAPEKAAKIRWVELSAQYVPRLWFMVLAGAAAFPMMDLLSMELRSVLRFYAWPVVLVLAWFPVTALRTAEAGEIHTAFRTALRRSWQGAGAFLCWLAVAGASFFLLHWLTALLTSLCPEEAWWRQIPAVAGQVAWVWLAVWMLGAWACIQVDKLALPARETRAPRRTPEA
jgi:hypothetical protein